MVTSTVLLLGGTADARELLAALRERGIAVLESVAGRTAQARDSQARVGGFGGAAGLADFLHSAPIAAVLDATHPFAAQITANAAAACASTGTPLLRFQRTGWADHPDAGVWQWVADHPAAARTAAEHQGVALLTVGRQPLRHYYESLPSAVARVAEWQGGDTPAGWRIIESRGPFDLPAELALLREIAAKVLVSKDSGGAQTAAKLDAARELGVPVVMVRRPAPPAGVEAADSVVSALAWLDARLNPDQDPPPRR